MKIAAITAGAGGMYCGSCLHDNTLAAALTSRGHDVWLIPTYTPIRTDEQNVSRPRVFLGGINVYLQQFRPFRWVPAGIRKWLDTPRLLHFASRFADPTRYENLGPLTLAMLQGETGPHRRQFQELADYLAKEVRPELVTLTNVLLSGLAPTLQRRLVVPVLAYLQCDDLFLDALPEGFRSRSIELIRQNGAAIAGYIATSQYYADHMAGYLGLNREKIDVVHP